MTGRAGLAALLLFLAPSVHAAPRPITLDVDAREAPRRIVHARLGIPAQAGPMSLRYPKWLPGEHEPNGPIVNVAGLKITAGGKPVAWTRDPVDMFELHLDVPAGATSLVVDLDYIQPAGSSSFGGDTATSTPELLLFQWNTVLLYPKGTAIDEQQVVATLKLPGGWTAGTALPIARDGGAQLSFAPASLTTLVDSPVLAGRHARAIPLLSSPPVRLFAAADSDALLEPHPELAAALARLPAEANALFGAYHYRAYTFLLTLSDAVREYGLEHHESSDDRTGERFLIDDDARVTYGGLLPHEMVHSWNGKYRRPADLQPGSFDTPMKGELLWVYEGLTEYLGSVLTARSGIYSPEEYREELAFTAAEMIASKGRSWRPLADTAVAAQLLYEASDDGASWRRGVDFYSEGELLWLEVDVTIRTVTGGKASIDDFVHRFHGGESGPPRVVPYTLDDVIAALNQTAPFDWKGFFATRVYATAPRPPLGGIEGAGWTLAWTDEVPKYLDARETTLEYTDLRDSLGFKVEDDGLIPDVVAGSPAAAAGVPPGAKLIAVNGRKWTDDRLRDAVRESRKRRSVELIVESGDSVSSHTLIYSGGERYPKLERVPGKPDLLQQIITPRSGRP